ncbi:hypothetical protein FNV43_RR00358 [Rhamnella rubrinervis]|uniref:Uncharacterized protein n=1 Tax=Rhamnella rubrinervis TaxID=2594499 RepID=A0A8K0HMP0_9ROSA|nr:hypothetical protein FNV43_RR00358 [Rhamnella rubrinervis]
MGSPMTGVRLHFRRQLAHSSRGHSPMSLQIKMGELHSLCFQHSVSGFTHFQGKKYCCGCSIEDCCFFFKCSGGRVFQILYVADALSKIAVSSSGVQWWWGLLDSCTSMHYRNIDGDGFMSSLPYGIQTEEAFTVRVSRDRNGSLRSLATSLSSCGPSVCKSTKNGEYGLKVTKEYCGYSFDIGRYLRNTPTKGHKVLFVAVVGENTRGMGIQQTAVLWPLCVLVRNDTVVAENAMSAHKPMVVPASFAAVGSWE